MGKPRSFLESQDQPTGSYYSAARLQCTPFYFDWWPIGYVDVVGAEILPSSKYDVRSYGASCVGSEATCTDLGPAVTILTRRSGDVGPNFNPPATSTQPDALDVAAVVNKLKNLAGALPKAVTQLQPNLPELNADVNALDITAVVDGVKQKQYAFSGPCPCPSLATCGALPCTSATVCTGSGLPGLGVGALCVKTCVGGFNAGEPCINNTHCPGGGVCGSGFCRDKCGRCTP